MREIIKLLGRTRANCLSPAEKKEVLKIHSTTTGVDLALLDLVLQEDCQIDGISLEDVRASYRRQLIDGRQVYLALASITKPHYRKIWMYEGLLTSPSLQYINNNPKKIWPKWLKEHYNAQVKRDKNYNQI